MSARHIPDAVRRKQAEASDPSCSAFVAANAGSGKTHVLAQRVIRLMLDGGPGGVDPSRILCITFTKAAAANMAARVYDRLRGWIALDDAALDAAMREIGVTAIDAAKRARARALVRRRAGDAGRPQGPDHPRLLHPAAPAVSVRGECGGALHRAGRPLPGRNVRARHLRRCCSGRRPHRRARSAARCERAVAGAADTTLLQRLREADQAAREARPGGSMPPAASSARWRSSRRRSASTPDDDLAAVEKEIVDGPHLPVGGMGRGRRGVQAGQSRTTKHSRRASWRRWPRPRPAAG